MTNQSKKKSPSRLKRLRAFLGSPRALRLLIGVVGALVMIGMFEAAIVPVRYELKIGMVPTMTIAATKDVEDEISTEEKRKQAAAAVTPTYRYQDGVTEEVMESFDQIFAQLRLVRQYAETLPDQSATRTYSKDELQYARDLLTLITLRDYQITSLMHSTQEELDDAYSLLYTALQSTMLGHVTEGQESTAVSSIRQIVNYRMSLSLSQNVAPAVLNACIRPNMVIDQEATEAAREDARNAVEPIVYKQGQNIVVKGEGRITARQLAMLSELGLLSDGRVDLSMYIGAAMLMTGIAVLLLLALRDPEYHILDSTSRLLLLLIIMLLTLGFSLLARLGNAYLAPVLLCALLTTALLGPKPGLICNVAMTLMVSALAAGGSDVYTETMVAMLTTGLISGTVASLALGKHGTRLRLLLAGFLAAAVNFLVVLALGLMTDNQQNETLTNGLWLAGSAILAMLLCFGIQPLLETIFNLPSPVKLMELSNPNQPLMRRLLLEAPGTYHHSIMVANLSEAAADAIGASPLLARVGGYYHDVGKLKRPLYFKENQPPDDNIHDRTDPQVSAEILTAHPRDGVALARAYRLPQAVIDIIAEHHGDTPVMYFYHKALQQANGQPVDIAAFRYDGHPPRSRESAIVMLCDTIEAAMRTLKKPTPEKIEEFIVKLVRGKLEDGQLSDCPLTLQDIDRICGAVTTVLVGVYHERIEYPEVEKLKPRILHQPEQKETPESQEKQMDAEQELPGEAEPVPTVPDPVSTPLPVITPEMETPCPVVSPEAPQAFETVEPPPAARPVPVETLMQSEAIAPGKAEKTEGEEKQEEETKPAEKEAQP